MKMIDNAVEGCELCGDPIPKGEVEIRYPTGAIIDMLVLCSDCADAFDEQEAIEHEEEELDYMEWYRFEVVGMGPDEQF